MTMNRDQKMLAYVFFVCVLILAAFALSTGCYHSPTSFSANMSLYNRGGAIDSGAGGGQEGMQDVNAEGGGAVKADVKPLRGPDQ